MANANYADAISGIESGGNYSALGPQTGGDRAYGRFQVMGANVPAWTEQYYGRRLTPEEFLANPDAQNAVFQGKFVGEYVPKFGPEGAAQAWLGGPGSVGKLDRKDVLGTSVGAYGSKFMKALGTPQAPEAMPMSQASPPVPSLSQPMPAYWFTPNNAPAGIPGAQPSPQQPQSGYEAPQQAQMDQVGFPQMAPMGAPRRPPDLTQLKALLARQGPQSRAFSFSRVS